MMLALWVTERDNPPLKLRTDLFLWISLWRGLSVHSVKRPLSICFSFQIPKSRGEIRPQECFTWNGG